MGREVLTIKIRNPDGVVLGEVVLEEPGGHLPVNPDRATRAFERSFEESQSRPITDSQRRLLWRLACRLGHQGQHAKAYIDRRLQQATDANREPDRAVASRVIDQLQRETGDGKGANHAA